MTPQTIGRYDVIGLLGKGGIGQVYEARDTQLGRIVAIKALRPEYSADHGFLARFHAEAASLANLSHPNITTLYDLMPLDGQLYMVMELVRGHTLEAVLTRCKQLGVREALAVIAQTAAGLGYAHSKDVIHRDIKPSNLMLTESGLVKIMDFGIARVRGSQRLTRVGSIVGTLFYVAPEQIKGGEGDEQSDEYSLGCVLYEMLSGNPPFQSESDYDLIKAHVEACPPPLTGQIPGLPASVEQALVRALEKNPKERFASVEQFSRALGAEAIQGQAAEIIRTKVLPLAGPIISEPARTIAAASDISAKQSSSGSSSKRSPVSTPSPAPMVGSADQMTASPNHMPAIVLAGTIVALSLGLYYFVFGGNLWPDPTQPEPMVSSRVDVSTPRPQPPTLSNQTNPPPDFPSQTVAGQKSQIANSYGPGQHNAELFISGDNNRREASPPVSQSSLLLQMAPAGSSQLPPTRNLPPSPALSPTPEKPAYQGRVANWMNADSLWVWDRDGNGTQALHLYGVISTPSPSQAKRDSEQLMAFINATGRTVTCYSRGIKFQCFAGEQDVALWAVKHGLARPADDAPITYREAAVMR